MVNDMVHNSPLKKETPDEAKVAINCAKIAKVEGPCRVALVWNVGVRMLKDSDYHQPMINPPI